MGKLIVIDGIDGAGKQTQAEILVTSLKQRGYDVKFITFPTYQKSSALVEMYLGGEFGENAASVNAYAASVFFAVDRIASFLREWKNDYEGGKIIVCDRYTTANAIHQLSKIERGEYDEYLTWLCEFEYGKLGLPKPDITIFLDVPVEVSQGLLSKRYKSVESKKDIHEKDLEYLYKCREAAAYSAEKLGFCVIECTENGEMRKVEEIAEDVLQNTLSALK